MALILSIDTMAERYKCLPSYIMNNATTFDLYIMDAALSYHSYKQKKDSGDFSDTYTVDELQTMMQKAKG